MEAQTRRNIDVESAFDEAERAYIASNPKSKAGWQKACASMPGGNTRTVLFFPPFPLMVTRGEGCRIEDADGHSYVDFLVEYTAGLYGHSQPIIMQAVRDALDGGIVLGGHTDVEARFAEVLCARIPSLDLVRFCNSGTEANLVTLSLARAHTGREMIMAFEGAYHGGVFYYSPGGSPLNVPFPMAMAKYNDIEGTKALIGEHAGELAAMVIEPMMGGGGCIPADPAFLAMLREECTRHGILLVFDEVMTSRLAPGGLQEALGITPDLTTLGKYLGGGLTFGAFGGRKDVMGRFDPSSEGSFLHSGTFNNNILTMSAGYAGLTKVYTPEASRALNVSGDALRARLNAAFAEHGVAGQVTGCGSMMTVHFQSGEIRSPEDATGDPTARALLHLEMLARGYYFARRGMINLSLPMGESELDGFAGAFGEFLAEYKGVLEAG